VSSILEILKRIKMYIFFGKNLFRSSAIKIKIDQQYKLLGKNIIDTYNQNGIYQELIDSYYQEIQKLYDELVILEKERNV
jgi:hypothetical protein